MAFQRLKLEDVKVSHSHVSFKHTTHPISDEIHSSSHDCVLQRIFTDFVTVEMLFHAKALEVYTHTFHNLEAMELQKDLEVQAGHTAP